MCIKDWGSEIEYNFAGNPENNGAPDPKQFISTFNTFEAYKNHIGHVHDLIGFCGEKSCLQEIDHDTIYNEASHGDIICKICDLSFKFQQHHDHHMESNHADLSMNKKQLYDLYLKYKYDFYKDEKQSRIAEQKK